MTKHFLSLRSSATLQNYFLFFSKLKFDTPRVFYFVNELQLHNSIWCPKLLGIA